MVKEGQGRSWMDHQIDISGEKGYVWGGEWWPVGLQCQPQSQTLSSGLWTLDLGLGFRTWIWDLDLGLRFGTRIWDSTWG